MDREKYIQILAKDIVKAVKAYRESKWKNVIRWREIDNKLYRICSSFKHDSVEAAEKKLREVDLQYEGGLARNRVDFYKLAARLNKSDLDNKVKMLGKEPESTDRKIIIEIVDSLSYLIKPPPASYHVFASKYFHFHFPEYFPILDKWSEKEIAMIAKKLEIIDISEYSRYGQFFIKIASLNDIFYDCIGNRYSYGDIDKYLYGISRGYLPKSYFSEITGRIFK